MLTFENNRGYEHRQTYIWDWMGLARYNTNFNAADLDYSLGWILILFEIFLRDEFAFNIWPNLDLKLWITLSTFGTLWLLLMQLEPCHWIKVFD